MARSVDEVALFRDTIKPLCACVDRMFINPKFVAPAARKNSGRAGWQTKIKDNDGNLYILRGDQLIDKGAIITGE
jgi:hypothetical protein